MVRKRSYKQCSDDSEDSDSDYTPENDDPQPKQYSLRKRTRQTFFEEFDYEVDDSDLSPRRAQSDDEDFELNENNVGSYVSYTQAPVSVGDSSQANNGLIDFEDVIRADIVINKNRVDCDKVIHKPEVKTGKRRGRPPKRKVEVEMEEEDGGFDPMSHSILGPLADASFLAPDGDFGNILEPVTQVETELTPVETELTQVETGLGSDLQNGCAEQEGGLSESDLPVEGVAKEDIPVEGTLVEDKGVEGDTEPAAEISESNPVTCELSSESKEDQSKLLEDEVGQNTDDNEPESETNCSNLEETEEATNESFKHMTDVNQQNEQIEEITKVSSETTEIPIIDLDDEKADDVIILDDKPDVIVLDD